MFASIDDAQAFLVHDIRFHRAVAAASGNPILAAAGRDGLGLFYETRKPERASRPRSARSRRKCTAASITPYAPTIPRPRAQTMNQHLMQSERAQVMEEAVMSND